MRIKHVPAKKPTLQHRRSLLIGSAAATLVGALAALATAADDPAKCQWPPPGWTKGFPSRRWVNVVFAPTGERFKDFYVDDGVYSTDAITRFSWTCRDFRANEWKLFDPRLLDLLFVLHWKYCKDEINILSGYRTPQTNRLAENPQQFEGEQANSLHAEAKALDIHLPNVDKDAVALDLRNVLYGGLGMYPHRDFLHVDMGPVRSWVVRPPVHTSSGSGFIVNRQGNIVTNAHVAKDCVSLTITHKGREIPVKRVLAMDDHADLALLSIDQVWPIAPVLSGTDVQMGDNIVALGYPLRGVLGGPIITTGIVNAMAGMRGNLSEMQISAQVQPGNSGGPVLDEAGRVVGVVVAQLDAVRMAKATGNIPQNVNFAVTLGALHGFLKSQRVESAEATEQSTLKVRDIAAQAQQYTVAVDCWK